MANLRSHLASALREAREAGGLTQEELAKRVRWTLFRIRAVEGAEVPIYEDELNQLLAALHNADTASIRDLFEAALAGEPVSWIAEQRYREHLNPMTTQMHELEGQATAIRIYQPLLIPGLLQTGCYTAAVVSAWGGDVAEERARVICEIRMRRKNAVFGRPDPPRVRALIDVSVLLRVVGSPRVMAEQLDALLDYGDLPGVHIRVMPHTQAGTGIPFGHFIIFSLGGTDGRALYREHESTDAIDQTPKATADYAGRFEKMWAEALNEEASADLVLACARALRGPSLPMPA